MDMVEEEKYTDRYYNYYRDLNINLNYDTIITNTDLILRDYYK